MVADHPRIVVVIPVLGRPTQAAIVLDSISRSVSQPVRVLFVATPGDDEEIDACRATGAETLVTPWQGGQGDYARKINHAVAITDEPFIFTGADDIRFRPGWDTITMAQAAAGAGVVGTIDRCNPRTQRGVHSTHSLVSRAYVEEHGTVDEPGKLYHEGYWHNFCDDELVATARVRRSYRPSQAVVEHLHPMSRKAPDDDTYRLGMEHFDSDRRLFIRRSQIIRRSGTRRRSR